MAARLARAQPIVSDLCICKRPDRLYGELAYSVNPRIGSKMAAAKSNVSGVAAEPPFLPIRRFFLPPGGASTATGFRQRPRTHSDDRTAFPDEKQKSRTLLKVSGLLCYLVPPPGIEPGSQPSEGRILSVEIQRGIWAPAEPEPRIIAHQAAISSSPASFPMPAGEFRTKPRPAR